MRGNCPEIKGQKLVCGVSEFRVCELIVEKKRRLSQETLTNNKRNRLMGQVGRLPTVREGRHVLLQAV